MKKRITYHHLFLFILFVFGFNLRAENKSNELPTKAEVLEVIYRANDYWQNSNSPYNRAFWDNAAYHTGNIAAYLVTKEQAYLNYSIEWSEHNQWKGAKSDRKDRWKYGYGESDDYVLFGDWQTCFQVYADIYNIEGQVDDRKVARAIEVMEYQMSTDFDGYWWWADGLYMVMPVMTRLHKITENPLFLEKLHTYWQFANDLMYDEEEGLYYRDGNYVFPKKPTINGLKNFWARGDGWVFAAFARVLEDLPKNDPYRDTYITYFTRMAQRLAELQQDEGYWTQSLLDPEHGPGYETSGTAFFTFGYLWGINNGYLSEEDFGETALKGWNYLTKIALHENGRLGYVQPVGAESTGHPISQNATANFGVGAFLLAAAEMFEYATGNADDPILRLLSVQFESPTQITVQFSDLLDISSAENIENYLLDGQPITGSASYDASSYLVTISLDDPLQYGQYTFTVGDVESEMGAKVTFNTTKSISMWVPLSPADNNIVVTAIGNQIGNTPENTLDNSLGTRWSQQGYGQWIKYDLGALKNVYAVDVAFYVGNSRKAFFDIEISQDDENYITVLENVESSGITVELERYVFGVQVARYIRIVCNGTTDGDWNSITEVRVRYSDEDLLSQVSLPELISSDIVMPAGINWKSSNNEVLTRDGFIGSPHESTVVTMEAELFGQTKSFEVTVLPRHVDQNNRLVYYSFDAEDLYEGDDFGFYLKDKSGNGNDARVYGNALIDGVLDLTANTPLGFNENGYLLLPDDLIQDVRSFSVLVKVNPESLENLPRIYDFGGSPGNSVFARIDGPHAGMKYADGQTIYIQSSQEIEAGHNSHLGFTFDAATKTTRIYVNGWMTAESKSIKHEPYQVASVQPNERNYIGRTQWWDTAVGYNNVDYCGTIDDFVFYNTALTKEEIASILNVNTVSQTFTKSPFYVYPNPVLKNQPIFLQSKLEIDKAQVAEMFNAQGKLLSTTKLDSFSTSIKGVENSGIYFLRISDVESGGDCYSLKLLVK